MGKWLRVIIDGPRDPQLNMAIDEALMLMRRKAGLDTLRLYMWSPTGVSIGRKQDASSVVDLDAVNRLGFKLVRRPTGGGALLHAEGGELTYSVVLGDSHPLAGLDVESSAARIAEGVARALRKLGLDARVAGESALSGYGGVCYMARGSSDVLVMGRKVSGSAQKRMAGALLQHGTILIDFSPEEWARVLKGGEGVERLVTSLKNEGVKVPLSRLIELVVEGFSETLGLDPVKGSMEPEEVELAVDLFKRKYSRPEWNLEAKV